LVEKGELNSPRARRIVEEETLPLIDAGADILVLGCTHYPFLRPLIEDVVGPDIQILDTGAAVANHVAQQLQNTCQPDTGQTSYRIITTGALSQLQNIFPQLCPGVDATLEKIDGI
jgi:glutamate racemase